MSSDPIAAPSSIPVLPPAPPANDPVSGVILQQMGQVGSSAPVLPGQPVGAIGSANKEGLSRGLPESTEISLPTATPESVALAGPETGSLAGSVEYEQAKELEPEVQEVQQKIADHRLKGPTETVIAAQTMPAITPNTVSQPVVILPLSEKEMNAGKTKDPTNSVRWLYVWCVRQIRKFAETLVVYRDE